MDEKTFRERNAALLLCIGVALGVLVQLGLWYFWLGEAGGDVLRALAMWKLGGWLLAGHLAILSLCVNCFYPPPSGALRRLVRQVYRGVRAVWCKPYELWRVRQLVREVNHPEPNEPQHAR